MRLAHPPRGSGEQALVGIRKAGVPEGSAVGGGLGSGASWIDEQNENDHANDDEDSYERNWERDARA
jgi:hypothetical protein